MKPLFVAVSAIALAGIALLIGSGSNQASAATASAVYPIVALGSGTQCILGGTSGGKWVEPYGVEGSPPKMQEATAAGAKYRLYSLAGYMGTSTGSKAESIGIPCEDVYTVKVSPPPTSRYEVIAVGGTWPAMPRLPKLEGNNQAVYIKAVADVLKQNGIASPHVKIQQVIRVDLDGDGASEVLIAATNYSVEGYNNRPAPSANQGDYSLVLMRKVVRGQVKTTVLASQYITKQVDFGAPNAWSIAGVLDLNGDRVMEVVLHGQYYEGDWHMVVEIKGTQSQEVLECGCGV